MQNITKNQNLIQLGKSLGFQKCIWGYIEGLYDSSISDSFEALLGALYIDKGFGKTASFIQEILVSPIIKNLQREYNVKSAHSFETSHYGENQYRKVEEFERNILEFTFKNKNILIECLTISENSTNLERFRQVGISVIKFIINHYLYFKFPKDDEGMLSKRKTFLLNSSSFQKVSEKMKLKSYAFISKNSKDFTSESLFQALVGAIYFEFGFKQDDQILDINGGIIFKHLIADHQEEILNQDMGDSKSKFQILIQKKFNQLPNYELIGKSHDYFLTGVSISNQLLCIGEGKTKKESEFNCSERFFSIIDQDILKINDKDQFLNIIKKKIEIFTLKDFNRQLTVTNMDLFNIISKYSESDSIKK